MKISLLTLAALVIAGSAVYLLRADIAPAQDGPSFTADGQLMRPENYREWIYLSSGLGMTYGSTSDAPPGGNPRFDNVFVNPSAYKSFLQTGTWPDQTIFVLEVRASESKGSINNGGHFQGDIVSISAEVKDVKRFPNKWAFFTLSRSSLKGALIPASAACYTCHPKNGAVDNTFVQFYPTLFEVAKRKGTLKVTAE